MSRRKRRIESWTGSHGIMLTIHGAAEPRRPSVGTIGRAIARSSRSVRSVRYFARIAAKLRQNAFRTICNFRFFDAEIFFSKKIFGRIFFFGFFFGFSLFSSDFGGSGDFWTSKSASRRYFASDGQIFRSVGRLEWSQTAENFRRRKFLAPKIFGAEIFQRRKFSPPKIFAAENFRRRKIFGDENFSLRLTSN